MKSYFILDCPKLQKIQDSLYGYYVGITANNKPKEFWTHCTRQQIKDYFSIPNLELRKWFDDLGLRVRDMSYTVWNEDLHTTPHVDAPPVIAKINVPVLNTLTFEACALLSRNRPPGTEEDPDSGPEEKSEKRGRSRLRFGDS